MPVPASVRVLPDPVNTLLIVVVLLTVKVELALRIAFAGVVNVVPSKVRLPLLVLPKVMVPLRVSELASVMAVPLSSKVPPLRVSVPVPKGPFVRTLLVTVVLAPATSVPAVKVVPC